MYSRLFLVHEEEEWTRKQKYKETGLEKKTTPFTLEFRKMKKEMTWHHQNVHPDVRKARFEKSEKREGTNLQPEILKDRVNILGSSHNHTSRLAPGLRWVTRKRKLHTLVTKARFFSHIKDAQRQPVQGCDGMLAESAAWLLPGFLFLPPHGFLCSSHNTHILDSRILPGRCTGHSHWPAARKAGECVHFLGGQRPSQMLEILLLGRNRSAWGGATTILQIRWQLQINLMMVSTQRWKKGQGGRLYCKAHEALQ